MCIYWPTRYYLWGGRIEGVLKHQTFVCFSGFFIPFRYFTNCKSPLEWGAVVRGCSSSKYSEKLRKQIWWSHFLVRLQAKLLYLKFDGDFPEELFFSATLANCLCKHIYFSLSSNMHEIKCICVLNKSINQHQSVH